MSRSDKYDAGLDDGWALAPIRYGACAEYLRGYLAGMQDAGDECAAVGIVLRCGSQVGKRHRYMLSEARRLLAATEASSSTHALARGGPKPETT